MIDFSISGSPWSKLHIFLKEELPQEQAAEPDAEIIEWGRFALFFMQDESDIGAIIPQVVVVIV